MDMAIRKMDADERFQRAYDDACAEIEAEMRAEYEAEFGPAFRAHHPFKPNGTDIHIEAINRLGRIE